MATNYGTLKQHARDIGYFTFNGVTYCAWTNVSYGGTVRSRANTNPASQIEQTQVMLIDTPTIECEINIPFVSNDTTVLPFIAGKVGVFSLPSGDAAIFPSMEKFQPFIIEKSTISLSREALTSVRMTLRGLGYTKNRLYSSAGTGNSGGTFNLWDTNF